MNEIYIYTDALNKVKFPPQEDFISVPRTDYSTPPEERYYLIYKKVDNECYYIDPESLSKTSSIWHQATPNWNGNRFY